MPRTEMKNSIRDAAQPTPRPIVTLGDIAVRCGVSKMTVSRALHGVASRVSKAKAAEIAGVAAELGYSIGAGHAARQLVMRKQGQRLLNHLIAVFMPLSLFDLPFFLNLYRGIIDGMQQERFGMLTHYSTATDANVDLLPFYERGEVDGALVLADPRHFQPLLSRLRAASGFGACPVVSLLNTFPGCAAVVANDRQGGYEAVMHLLALGHRRILHFWDRNGEIHLQRYMGAMQACAEYGLDGDAVLVGGMPWGYADNVRAAPRFAAAWEAFPGCTAILAPNDMGAVWIADFLAARGLRVPEDVSLIGYDDSDPLLDPRGRNLLTTVQLPLREIGYEAARLVVRQVREATPTAQVVALPTALQIRGTTAPPRVASSH